MNLRVSHKKLCVDRNAQRIYLLAAYLAGVGKRAWLQTFPESLLCINWGHTYLRQRNFLSQEDYLSPKLVLMFAAEDA
jgi:hypothetical protein